MSDEQIPVLWHIKISNFNEKARWALDYKRVAHRRRAPLPGAHQLVALALTRRSITFPVLVIDGRAIGDSSAIIAALEERVPDPPLYPADPALRRRALELEEFFDENLGGDLRRVVFHQLLGDPELMRASAGQITSPAQGRIIDAGFPLMRAMLRRRYAIDDATAAQSLLKVRAAMALIADLLRDGDGEHLVGGAFTVADLAGAGLLAPLIVPPELPYRRPGMPLPDGLQRISDELGAHPAADWVRRTYARYRPQASRRDHRSALPLPDASRARRARAARAAAVVVGPRQG